MDKTTDKGKLETLAQLPVWTGSEAKTALAIVAAFGERQVMYVIRYAGRAAKSYSILLDVSAYLISNKAVDVDALCAEHRRGSTEAEMIEKAISFLQQAD